MTKNARGSGSFRCRRSLCFQGIHAARLRVPRSLTLSSDYDRLRLLQPGPASEELNLRRRQAIYQGAFYRQVFAVFNSTFVVQGKPGAVGASYWVTRSPMPYWTIRFESPGDSGLGSQRPRPAGSRISAFRNQVFLAPPQRLTRSQENQSPSELASAGFLERPPIRLCNRPRLTAARPHQPGCTTN
jgi:hypothetical protein